MTNLRVTAVPGNGNPEIVVDLDAATVAAATPRPMLDYLSATEIDISPPLGYPSGRYTMQDGTSRSFTGALTFDPSLGAVEGGLDVGAEAPSVWYYLYLVPTAANDLLLCCRGSLRTPDLGPTGYTNFKYIGAVYNNAASNLRDFHHDGGRNFWFEELLTVYSDTAVEPDGAPVLVDLSAVVPWTATAVSLYGDLECPPGGTTFEWYFSMHATGGGTLHLEVRNTSTLCNFAWVQPIHTTQTIYRQLLRTVGAAKANVFFGTNGWEDAWLN